MKTSQAGLKFIAQNEGTVLHVYNDSRGLPTIGVGHLLTQAEIADKTYSFGITQQKALELLAADVATAEYWVNKSVTVVLTQNQFDCCVDFTYNCGGGAFASSTFLRKINASDTQGAADAILMWDKPPEIMGRRHLERTLFLTPDPVVVAPPAPPVPPAPPPPVPVPVQPVAPPPVVLPPSNTNVWASIAAFFAKLFSKGS
jgi:lysozyme